MSEADTSISQHRARHVVTRWQMELAGLLAAAAALGMGELLSGLSRKISSLVFAVGEVIIDRTPGWIARWSIDTLGSAQKPALVWGITVVSILLGGVLGGLSRRWQWVAPAGLAIFGVVGGWAAARAPQASSLLGWMSGLVSAAVGIAVFGGLVRLLQQPTGATAVTPGAESAAGEPPPPQLERRWFLGASAALAGLSLSGALVGRWLRERANVEGAREEAAVQLEQVRPRPAATPATSVATGEVTTSTASAANYDHIDGLASLITPNDEFYRIDTALSFPQVDPSSWRLRVNGLVDRELELSFDDLLGMDLVQEDVTLSCVSNRVGGDLVGNATWVGVPLIDLLNQAGVQRDASQIVGRSVDGWTAGFPTEVAGDGRVALVALSMNGEPLPIRHGFPARLVVAGLYGYVSATKWLSEIELTTWDGFDGYWIPRGWSKEGPIKTQSRIDVPNHRSNVPAGPTAVAGVAWAPTRAIERVEVQIDDRPWNEAELSIETTTNSWRQWLVMWDATPGDHRIRVRATDGTGETQTMVEDNPPPDGATGWHTISVNVREA